MPSLPDPRKAQQWRERFTRFENSSQTVAEFCLGEGVSQPSFYQWRKKLGLGSKRVRSASGPGTSGLTSELGNSEKSPSSSVAIGEPRPRNFHFVSLASLPSDQLPVLLPVLLPKALLPGGIELELGSDVRLVESIVKQLIESSGSELEPPSC